MRIVKAVAIIPARLASTRLPAKALLRETGKYLIQHVCDQAAKARSLSDVIVATDDQRIVEAVRLFGGRAEMTRTDHVSGTDRIAEVAQRLDCDIVVNVQGDEPEIEPESIDLLVSMMEKSGGPSIATLACPFPVGADPADPNAVKVVCNEAGEALYFSRSKIPYPRGGQAEQSWWLHVGIYAYRRETLLEISKLPPTGLERTESLEQLRWLGHGYRIAVGRANRAAVGIDTPEDYAAFVNRCRPPDAGSRTRPGSANG